VDLGSLNEFVFLLCIAVKLGGMLAYTPLDEKGIQLLLNHLHDFLKYVPPLSFLRC